MEWTSIIAWIGFNLFVLIVLLSDLYIFHKDAHEIRFREALTYSISWIVLALLFCVGVYIVHGKEYALTFLAGYLIEKSLSIDNLFVFLVTFTYFSVPKRYLHTILFWGILGALVMRALFIFAGVVLIREFHWIIYVFGTLLIFTGLKLAFQTEHEIHPERNPFLKLLKKFMPITDEYHRDKFIIFKNNRYWATPLLVVLIIIESTDILFAFDSVPAILAITQDPFIVYTSNVFAILGLRAHFFVLSNILSSFRFLNYGLAILLIFIGCKMLLDDYVHIPISITLLVIAVTIGLSMLASVFARGSAPRAPR